MGYTVHELQDGWTWFTRGGLRGNYITHKDQKDLEIEIPSSLIMMLVADEIRSISIGKLEQMDDCELLGLPIAEFGDREDEKCQDSG